VIRAGVIGVGAIGRHHARVYNDLDGVTLVGVADPDPERRAVVARRFGVPAYPDHVALLAAEAPDVVSVAVPTVHHHAVALAALAGGAHVLVEKPIALRVGEAQAMIAAAAAAGRVLTVGHVERFNPAVVELKRRLDQGELGRVFQVHARRLSPFPAYIRDVGVVMDLATHELDVLTQLVPGPVIRLYAETERNIHERHEDMLSGILRFAGGTVGVLDVNWLTPNKVRRLQITGAGGMFLADYLHQDLFFYENSEAPASWDALALFKGVEEGNVIKIRIAKQEPLVAELRAFVQAAAGLAPVVVTGQDGLRVLALAELLLASAATGQALDVAAELQRLGWPPLHGDA
jgi:UDP-N-acetylglucosamine 3-dehydrogenase